MKKILILGFIILSVLLTTSCDIDNTTPNEDGLTNSELAVLEQEKRKSFDFFWETANTNTDDLGYGLIPDRYPSSPSISSIASVGFGLAAYVIGVDSGYITYDQAYERVDKTLDTLLRLDRVNGFYYHFVNIRTGQREWNSEISIIDTGLLLMGGIAVAEYFDDQIKTKVNLIYDSVNWPWYVNNQRNMFYMGYSPESGFSGAWDHVSEQLMLYILASGAPTYSIPNTLYNTLLNIQMTNYLGRYISTKNPNLSVNTSFYYSWNGSLFQHQFSHGFIDFNSYIDPNGINWFENARLATLANYAYTQDYSDLYVTYSENSWGITASDGPGEYNAYGAQPAKQNSHNGTIAPYGAIASINYTPKLSAQAALHYYTNVDGLFSTYGFVDAYNLGLHDPSLNPTFAQKTPWMATDVIGIDKGITLIMLANYKNNLIWDLVMSNNNVIAGLTILGFSKK